MIHKLNLFAIIALSFLLLSCRRNGEPVSTPSIKLGETEISVSMTGGDNMISVAANCDWHATSDQPWVKISPATGTPATTSIHLLIEENNTGAVRTAIVTVAGQSGAGATLSVNQSDTDTGLGKIANAEDFVDFLKNASSATSSDVFTVTEDIDMGGAVLAPAIAFSGVLEGENHKIYNYRIESGQATSGLMLTLSGTVKDLVLGSADGKSWDGKSIVTFSEGIEATSHIGGVAAVLYGTLENVKNFAKVSMPTKTTSLTGIGGLVGMTETASQVVNCENGAVIEASGPTAAETYIGGIIAYINHAEAVVSGCVNSAPLTVSLHIFKASMFGGIVGRANLGATIRDCSNHSAISFSQPDAETNGNYIMIAGIAGALYTGSKALNCTNDGRISSNNLQVSRIGGIVGTLNGKGTIENCTNNGDVSIKQSAANNHWQAAGGICGFQEKGTDNIIRNNTNNGAVTVEVQNLTSHKNKVNAGGILGLGVLEVTLEGNTNKGSVSIVNLEAGPAYAGGIVGWFYGAGSMGTGNRNEGDISCTNAAGAGSLAGKNDALFKDSVAGGKVNGARINSGNLNALAFGSSSTGSSEGITTASGESSKELTVAFPEIKVEAAATSVSVGVKSNVSWTVTTDAGWITSYTRSGSNDGTIELSFSANESTTEDTTEDRTATFTVSADGVSSVTFTVIQSKVLDMAPHCISSAAELLLFAEATAEAAPNLSRWQDPATKEVNVTGDIDATTLTSPIVQIPEGIVFNGNGHKIYNITLSTTGDAGFILENKGTVKNLLCGSKDGTVHDGKSEISVTGSCGSMGLVAKNNGTLQQVKNFVKMNYSAPNSAESGLGGIAGTTTAASEIRECENYGMLTVPETVMIGGQLDVGGIIGFSNADGAVIAGCNNKADIRITAKVNKVMMIGGIVGNNRLKGTYENCTNYNRIAYEQGIAPGTWMAIGGIAGAIYTGGVLKQCHNKGEVFSNLQQVIRIGGIAGVLNKHGYIQNNTNDGAVVHAQKAANGNWQAVGGIVGFEEAGVDSETVGVNEISGNVNNGSITVTTDNTSTHANKIGVGGIIGTTCSFVDISNNTNNGPVKAKNTGTTALYVGGIEGWYLKGKTFLSSKNTNTAAIDAQSSSGATGGVIGNSSTLGTSTEDKNTGAITATTPTNQNGIIAGLNAGTLSNSQCGGTLNGTKASAENVQGGASTGSVSGAVIL